MWFGVIGFLISFLGGWLISYLLDLCKMGGTRPIFLDDEQKYINCDLFSPPIARRIKKRNAKLLEKDSNVRNFQ